MCGDHHGLQRPEDETKSNEEKKQIRDFTSFHVIGSQIPTKSNLSLSNGKILRRI